MDTYIYYEVVCPAILIYLTFGLVVSARFYHSMKESDKKYKNHQLILSGFFNIFVWPIKLLLVFFRSIFR